MKTLALTSVLLLSFLILITAQNPVVKLERKGIYYGLDNNISLSVADIKPENLLIETDNGTIEGKNGSYNLKPAKTGLVKISIYKKTSSGKELIKTLTYTVKAIPETYPTIAGMTEGKITKEKLLEANEIKTEVFEGGEPIRITGFTISTQQENGYYIDLRTDTCIFNDKVKYIINNAVIGKKIYFESIYGIDTKNRRRAMGSISFEIIE